MSTIEQLLNCNSRLVPHEQSEPSTVNECESKTFVKEASTRLSFIHFLKVVELMSCREFEVVSCHAAQRWVFAMAGY